MTKRRNSCFNAARGFVGGATTEYGSADLPEESFNAARGFVGGAAIIPHCAFTKLAKFQCRTRLCGWCSRGAHAARGYSLSPLPPLRGPPPPLTHGRLFSYGISASLPDARNLDCHIAPSQREGLRYFSFPHRYGGSGERSEPIGAPMPHAALWVVQLVAKFAVAIPRRFNAARGFVGGATKKKLSGEHVALAFQCRTRLCGWCNSESSRKALRLSAFNAARGFVGGATASLAALVPLWGKSPFGKSPEI